LEQRGQSLGKGQTPALFSAFTKNLATRDWILSFIIVWFEGVRDVWKK
jgi:hypothetical protein